ncbi:MAG: TcpQ domain-containing protein [Pseudomonadota bacterium]
MAKNALRRGIFSVSAFSGARSTVWAVSSVVLLTWASPVFAGFEWKAPVPVPPPATVSTQPAAAPAPNDIQWDKSVPVMPVQKVQDVESASIVVTDRAPETAAPITMTDSSPPTAAVSLSAEIISGFGTELPLEVALQQIIPPAYKVSLAPGVNPAIIVSWKGERPWEQVLTDMLSARNLGFSRQNDIITVSLLPTIYPSVPTSSSSVTIRNTDANRVDMIPEDRISGGGMNKARSVTIRNTDANRVDVIPEDMISGGGMNKARNPISVVAPLAAPAPLTNSPRVVSPPETENRAVETEKPGIVTIRRDKPAPSLISRLLRLNSDQDRAGAVPPPEKTVRTEPSVKEPAEEDVPEVPGAQKAGISPVDAMPDNRKVDLAAYYRTEQASENKKADMLSPETIPDSKDETPEPAAIRAEKPEPLTDRIPVPDMRKDQAASAAPEPEVKMAEAVMAGVQPDAGGSSWSASGGQTLRTILSDWSRMAKVELHWDIDYDYRLNEDVAYKGSFNNAVEKLLDRYARVRPQPYGRLIQKQGGDNILIVNSYDISH